MPIIIFSKVDEAVNAYESLNEHEKRVALEFILHDKMLCYLDGNALCVTRPGFWDLVESPAVFIELTKEQIAEIEKLRGGEK